jgi:hypothetical protein
LFSFFFFCGGGGGGMRGVEVEVGGMINLSRGVVQVYPRGG